MLSSMETEAILVNAPIKVNFAGLRGNTMQMQKDGWQLSVETDISYQYHGYSVRLAGKHTGLNLTMYSGIAMLDLGMLHSRGELIRWFDHMEFPISAQNIAQNIMMPGRTEPTMQRFSVDFSNPYMDTPNMDRLMDLEDIFFFRGFDEEKSIYVPDEIILSTQDYLDKVLAGQKEKQKELREKARKKKYRREGDMGHQGDFTSDLSRQDIKLQLVGI